MVASAKSTFCDHVTMKYSYTLSKVNSDEICSPRRVCVHGHAVKIFVSMLFVVIAQICKPGNAIVAVVATVYLLSQ
jgi:hypothetical protein